MTRDEFHAEQERRRARLGTAQRGTIEGWLRGQQRHFHDQLRQDVQRHRAAVAAGRLAELARTDATPAQGDLFRDLPANHHQPE